MDLVNDNMRDAGQGILALELTKQHSSGTKE
jgi:hypothetical protein